MVQEIKEFKSVFLTDSTGSIINPITLTAGTINFLTTSTIGASITALPGATSSVTFSNTSGTVNFPTSSTFNTLSSGVSYTPVHKYQQVNVVTGTAIWIPASGKQVNLTDYLIASSTANTITLIVGTSSLGFVFAAQGGGAISNQETPIVTVANGTVSLTTTAGTTYIGLDGWES